MIRRAFLLLSVFLTLPVLSAELVSLDAPISTWDEGIPLGNGRLGALLWGGGDTLNLTLDRSDFWHNSDNACYLRPDFGWATLKDIIAKNDDKRHREIFSSRDGDSSKLPGVRLVLKLGGGATLSHFALDGDTAVATIVVKTPSGNRELRAWIAENDDLLTLQVPEGVTFASREFLRNPSFEQLGGYPEPMIESEGNCLRYRRLRRKGSASRFDNDFVAGVRFVGLEAKADTDYWQKFNAQSSVSIPDAEMQRLYDFTIYLYGAGARAGRPPIALQGLWTCDNNAMPPWNGDYHNDLNTEMTYWAAGPAGCIEALEAFADFYIERLPEFTAFSKKVFGGGEGALITATMAYSGALIGGWTAYMFHPTHGIWAFCTFCDAWEYDPTPEKAAKYLAFGREVAKGLENAYAKDAPNGEHRLEISVSPEWNDNYLTSFFKPNTTYDRNLLNAFYGKLARMAEACGKTEEAAKWRAYVGSFGPVHVDEHGVLMIADKLPMTGSHRHLSHLMQIFPLQEVPVDPEVNAIASMDSYEKLGTGWWVGYSFGWTGIIEARLGRPDRAYRYLKDFQRAFVTRNGFHVNGDQIKAGLSYFTYRPMTLEGNFAYARGIQEMLLTFDPHRNEVRLFNGVPKEWDGKVVSFENLLIPGGHRISAKRDAQGEVTWNLKVRPGTTPAPKVIPPANASGKKAI